MSLVKFADLTKNVALQEAGRERLHRCTSFAFAEWVEPTDLSQLV